jgi:hypothetical protein
MNLLYAAKKLMAKHFWTSWNLKVLDACDALEFMSHC